MQKYIGFTKVALPYGWLGNMAPYPVEFKGKVWRTTEALFQAMRFDDETIREKIREQKSPMGAKFVAKRNTLLAKVVRGSAQDLANMELCVKLKLEQHTQLKGDLKKTGDTVLFEDVSARKNKAGSLTWGAVLENEEFIGENALGNIWMKFRSLL